MKIFYEAFTIVFIGYAKQNTIMEGVNAGAITRG